VIEKLLIDSHCRIAIILICIELLRLTGHLTKEVEMRYSTLIGILACVVIVLCTALSVGQEVPLELDKESAAELALTYVDSLATYLGQGVVYILNLITGDRVSEELEAPIGYLTFITLVLVLFGLIDFARKIIWIGIIVGWGLLIVRIILDALGA